CWDSCDQVTLWLKGEYGDVELRTGGGKIVGKVISKRQEMEKVCEVEAAQEIKLHLELGVGERVVRHDLLTLDRLANLYNEIFQKEAAQEIKIDGIPALAWTHIIESFSEDECKELYGLFMTEEMGIISAEEKSFNRQDSLYIPIYLDRAFIEFVQKLDAGPKKLMELWEAEEELVNVRDYLVPQSLACILESLFAKYGDVSVEFTLSSSRVKMFLYVILCGTIDSMCETRVQDISEDELIHWWTYLKALLSAGFKIQFAFDHLNRVVRAYFGLRLKKQVQETLSQLKRDITVCSAQLNELTTKLDLLKYKQKRIMSEESGKKSSLIDECLKEATRLKWRKAGQGLQLKLG
ncbi:hypothetical protein CMV_023451, partial [Castanea mollissima]